MNAARGCSRPYPVGNYSQLRKIWRSEFRVENRLFLSCLIPTFIRENAPVLHARARSRDPHAFIFLTKFNLILIHLRNLKLDARVRSNTAHFRRDQIRVHPTNFTVQLRISLRTKLTFNVASGVAGLRGGFEHCRNARNSGRPDAGEGGKRNETYRNFIL